MLNYLSYKEKSSLRLRVGVNFDGIRIADRQHRQKGNPPSNYISDSFRIFSKNGINCLRIPFYWESYERDPVGFMRELDEIAKEADSNNIMCIYDNHQWECSSFLGWGIGFPDSLMKVLFQREYRDETSSNRPKKPELEVFWNRWWDRRVVDHENNDAWELQKDFLIKVIIKLADRDSTLGFEILNEPQVFRSSDFRKVSEYNNFMIDAFGKYTEKPLFFSYVYSNTITSMGFPWRQAKIKPTIRVKNKLIFDVHPYPPYHVVLLYYKFISFLMRNDIVFAGEYNSGIGENSKINLQQHLQYIKRFMNLSFYGAAFWWWTYEPDNSHPAFNLTNIEDNRIQPNKNFEYLVESLRLNIKNK